MSLTIYSLKPRFQALIRPLVGQLANVGITANQVTVTAAVLSVALGGMIAANATIGWLYLLIPVWFPIRMMLNAIDGMLANEFGQKTSLGAYLNEVTDVVSDAALYLPFAFVLPFTVFWIGLVIFLAVLTEFAGVLATMIGAPRRYDGPMGKSDRAFVFGALGLWVGLSGELPAWMIWVLPGLSILLILTIINRVRSGLRTAHETNANLSKAP